MFTRRENPVYLHEELMPCGNRYCSTTGHDLSIISPEGDVITVIDLIPTHQPILGMSLHPEGTLVISGRFGIALYNEGGVCGDGFNAIDTLEQSGLHVHHFAKSHIGIHGLQILSTGELLMLCLLESIPVGAVFVNRYVIAKFDLQGTMLSHVLVEDGSLHPHMLAIDYDDRIAIASNGPAEGGINLGPGWGPIKFYNRNDYCQSEIRFYATDTDTPNYLHSIHEDSSICSMLFLSDKTLALGCERLNGDLTIRIYDVSTRSMIQEHLGMLRTEIVNKVSLRSSLSNLGYDVFTPIANSMGTFSMLK